MRETAVLPTCRVVKTVSLTSRAGDGLKPALEDQLPERVGQSRGVQEPLTSS